MAANAVDEMLAHLRADFIGHEPDSQVASFYANRCVFITGATGFIGKFLVEKLLRSCRDISRIYLLIREQRGRSAQERLQDMTQSQIFDSIRSEPGGARLLAERLVAVAGDISAPGLGVAEGQLAELAEQVSVVFNSAASVRFVEPLDVAVRNNIASLGHLFQFCDKLRRLEALVHLSTAYSNCHKRDKIREIFYEPPMSGQRAIQAVEQLRELQASVTRYPSLDYQASESEESECEEGGPRRVERRACKPQRFYPAAERACDLTEEFNQFALRQSNRPNTYCLTKAIAEHHLLELAASRPDRYGLGSAQVPVAVVRPSITTAAWREPLVGFIDNFNGGTSPIMSTYLGAMQANVGVGRKVFDFVPVDMVSNALVCVGWFLAAGRHAAPPNSQPVRPDQGVYLFNFVSGSRNPMLNQQMIDVINRIAYIYPSKKLVRLCHGFFWPAGRLFDLYDLLNNKLPAQVSDLLAGWLCWLRGKRWEEKRAAMRGYAWTRAVFEALEPFTSNQWRFSDANVRALSSHLSAQDRHLFAFDVAAIRWPDYIRNYVIGGRLYALKDPANSLVEARRLLKKRQTTYRLSLVVLLLSLLYFCFA